jgi:hypothetical protein
MTDPDRARSGSVIRVTFYSDAMITVLFFFRGETRMTDPDRARSGSVIRVTFYSDAMITVFFFFGGQPG